MRKSKVLSISLPPEIYYKIERKRKKIGESRSGIIRDMIASYFNTSKPKSYVNDSNTISDNDVNRILKLYYEFIQKGNKDVIVICLGIITKGRKVLIGRRSEIDKHVKKLSWAFPGGRVESLDFKKEVKREVKEETNLDVEVKQTVHARLIPDSPKKTKRIVATYFHCKVVKGRPKPGGDFDKLKWIDPNNIFEHFTTSTADEVVSFLGKI